MAPFFLASNILVWISAVIVMGICSFFLSTGAKYTALIYEEVISVLTVAFFLAAFFLGTNPGYILLFNLIFSYLWLVAVVFTSQQWAESSYDLGLTVMAFSYIAFFFLFFNVLYSWYLGHRTTRTTRAVV